MQADTIHPPDLFCPRRKITGISAILLPFCQGAEVDWRRFEEHLTRTVDHGLTPAVNMDTGYVNLLDDQTIADVLSHTRRILGNGSFVAGAFVKDDPGSAFNLSGYQKRIGQIQEQGGTPVIFPSYGLTGQSDDGIITAYRQIASSCDRFIGFELGTVFAPFGKIYSLDVYNLLMQIPQCIGAKHSSLERELEWQRLIIRNTIRPEFKVFTGNDLAIDMVMYGSDYLLGLSTFAPDLFARRDAMWESGDPAFYQLNDVLQYLGFFTFRDPAPAYKHSAAMFLLEQEWLDNDLTHPDSPRRPESDRPVLRAILKQLERYRGD